MLLAPKGDTVADVPISLAQPSSIRVFGIELIIGWEGWGGHCFVLKAGNDSTCCIFLLGKATYIRTLAQSNS